MCEYCCEAWKPLLRIVESYPYDEIDVHGACEDCEKNFAWGDPDVLEAVCGDCEARPIAIRNKLNLTVYVGHRAGELVLEDKVQMRDYMQKINYCPMCGRKLERENENI